MEWEKGRWGEIENRTIYWKLDRAFSLSPCLPLSTLSPPLSLVSLKTIFATWRKL